MASNTALKKVMSELAALEDPNMRVANERRGDDHAVNLTQLRSLAKQLKTQHDLALQLWATGERPRACSPPWCARPKGSRRMSWT
jgi:3-methyladenine DNA glycosylase AlkD